MGNAWQAVELYLVQGLIAIIGAGVPFVVAWFRSRTQRLVIEQAATEAEALGFREGMSGARKKEFATTLATSRMGMLTMPGKERLDRMVEEALPAARKSIPPPSNPRED